MIDIYSIPQFKHYILKKIETSYTKIRKIKAIDQQDDYAKKHKNKLVEKYLKYE